MTRKKPQKKTTTKKAADPRDSILMQALPDVAFDGWHDGLVASAAKKAGIAEKEAAKLFPQGAESLILHFMHWATEKSVAAMQRRDLDAMRVRDRITLGVRARTEALAPWKEAVIQGTSYMGRPPRALRMPRAIWDTADRIWQAAGDTATDYNRYTKRLLLSGVLTATMLYWLRDTSAGSEKTWAFLDDRIENVMTFGKAIGKLRGRGGERKKA